MIEKYRNLLLKKDLKKRKTLCAVAAGVTAMLNMMCVALRTENNHSVMLTLNIVLDVLCGWGIIYYRSVYIVPWQKILALMEKESQQICGEIDGISEEVCCHMGLDCRCISIGERKLFHPVLLEPVKQGQNLVCEVVAGVIVEVSHG